jgi:hypothetical protein
MLKWLRAGLVMTSAGLLGVAMWSSPSARADVVAYLIGVTVRPGYHSPSADAALGCGHGICDKVSQGRIYAQVMGDVKADFSTSDDNQASYLISQAVNELRPSLIWRLRNSAAHYRPPPAGG